MKYRDEIDGLRALSVLGVVFFHFGFLSVSGGFFGVDIFFVISGYLISSLLFAEIDSTGKLSISQFYLRRTRRILPALLVFCIASYLGFAVFLQNFQSPFPHYGNSLLAALFSVSNIFFWLNSGYFALDSWAEPLLHTWSLGVEEQFYLVIPLLLFILAKGRASKRTQRYWAVFLCMACLSFAFCRWGRDIVGGDFIFYMLPTRMWELLVGVLVALLLRKFPLLDTQKLGLANMLAAISVGTMIFGFFNYHETTRIAEKALVITLAAGLFLVTANQRTLVGRLFSSPPLRFVGKISYSWYLWHWPMASLAVMIPVKYPGANETIVRSALLVGSLVFAYVSWKLVETPFRRIKTWPACVRPLAPLFCVLVLIALGNSFEFFGSSPYAFEQSAYHGISLRRSDQSDVGILGNQSKPLSFVLLGNSHAQSVAPAIDELAAQYSVRGAFMQDGVMPYLHMRMVGEDRADLDYRQALREYLTTRAVKKVLVVARWDHIWEHARAQRILWRDEPLEVSAVEEVFFRELADFLADLSSSGVDVWVMEQVPRAELDPTVALRMMEDYIEPYRHGVHNDLVRKAVEAAGVGNIHLLSPYPFFVKDGQVRFTHGKSLLYFDADHLSVEGARHIKELFVPFFESPPVSQGGQ